MGGIRDGIRILIGALMAPPKVRAIFEEARRRQSAAIAKRNAEEPGWQRHTFDGPDSVAAFAAFVDEVAVEHGVSADVRKWAKEMFAKATADG